MINREREKVNLNFGSINKLTITEEKINAAICFVVTESNRQLCFTRSCKFADLSDIFRKFSSVFSVLRESFRSNVSRSFREPFVHVISEIFRFSGVFLLIRNQRTFLTFAIPIRGVS